MSIFGSIVSAIFGTAKAAAEAVTGVAAPAKPRPMTREEVEAKIQKIAKDFLGREKYNWKQSIVDLMKLLDLDSSLGAREQLAKELGYTGKLERARPK